MTVLVTGTFLVDCKELGAPTVVLLYVIGGVPETIAAATFIKLVEEEPCDEAGAVDKAGRRTVGAPMTETGTTACAGAEALGL